MRPIQQSRIRRILASVLLLCFAFYGIEAEVADIHDQDSEAVQLSAHEVSGTPDHGSTVPNGTQPGEDSHAFHVCHCSHSHGGVILTATIPASAMVHACTEQFQLRTEPSTLPISPPVRPPII